MGNIISLFSGCGGLDLGFKQAGYKTIMATDIWDIACTTLTHNKIADEVINDDIRNIDFKQYHGKIDGVIGGPPCQAYSIVGRARDPKGMQDDPRNHLYKYYVSFLKKYNPIMPAKQFGY